MTVERDKYAKNFNRKIDRIEIHGFGRNKQNNAKLANFLQTHCSTSVKIISFVDCVWSKCFEKKLQCILQTAEVIRFSYICFNMGFPTKKYPKIKEIVLHAESGMMKYPHSLANLAKFLVNNPNVKRFECNVYDLRTERLKQILNILIESNQIEELCLYVKDVVASITFVDELKTLEKRSGFKQMILEFSARYPITEDIFKVASLKKLTAIKLQGFKMVNSLETFQPFAHLKDLHLVSCVELKQAEADLLARNIPNLEGLYLIIGEQLFRLPRFVEVNAFHQITPFARYSSKLKKVIVKGFNVVTDSVGSEENIMELDAARKQLENACKLMIYVDERLIHLPILFANTEAELIAVKLVPIRAHGDSRFFDDDLRIIGNEIWYYEIGREAEKTIYTSFLQDFAFYF